MTQLARQADSVLTSPTELAPASVASQSLSGDIVQLLKPRITVMVAIMAMIGYWAAVRSHEGLHTDWLVLTATLLGTTLSCMGAAVLNQVYERDTDALMHRTRMRPLPAGRVSVKLAMLLGLGLSLAGVVILTLGAGVLAGALGGATVLSYTLVYTPLKRITHLATIIGAAPGALPPVIGYAAAADLDLRVGLMFAIMFTWQLPHFLAIAWMYREDYTRAGIPVLPVLDPSGESTFRQIALWCMVLLPLGLLPAALGQAGMIYALAALASGAVFLGFGIALWIGRKTSQARTLFFVSLIYLPVVLTLMVADGR